jgi:hypothetical protein
MKPVPRLFLLIFAGCLCAAAPTPSWSEEFSTVDGQGADPILQAFPFFIFENSTKTAQIVFETDRRLTPPVPVTLDVQCCTDPSGASVQPADVTFEAVSSLQPPSSNSGKHNVPPVLQPNQFMPDPGVARSVWLKVTTGAHPTPGRYLATVKATLAGEARSTQVIVNVLPTYIDSVTPRCVAFTAATTGANDVPFGASPSGASLVPTDGLVQFLKPFFDKKATNPSQAMDSLQTGWAAGNAANAGNNAILITLSKTNLPLTPTQALLAFVNSTDRDKEFIAFNSALCVPVATILLKSGESTTLLTDTLTTTIFVRRNVSAGWESISVLSEPLLWTVLGGRVVTFDWKASHNEH